MYVEFFLRRPILSSVLAMLTVIGGAIARPEPRVPPDEPPEAPDDAGP